MSEKTISKLLKSAIFLMAAMCFCIHCCVSLIALVSEVPEVHAARIPWLIFIWMTAIPMIPALVYSWKTASNIGKSILFQTDNAKNLHIIALSALADTVIVFVGGILLLLLNFSHPGLMLLKIAIAAMGFAIFAAAEGLSQLIKRAANLQEDADLTI